MGSFKDVKITSTLVQISYADMDPSGRMAEDLWTHASLDAPFLQRQHAEECA